MAGAKLQSGNRAKRPAKALTPDGAAGVEALASEGERSELPEEWEWASLRDLVEVRKGKRPTTFREQSATDALPYIDIKAFESRNFRRFADPASGVQSSESDVFIVWDGARAGLVGRGIKGVLGSTIAAFTPRNVDGDYLRLFLQSQYESINKNTKGSTIPHISSEYLWSIQVPVPSLPEQRRIVARIDEFAHRAAEIRKLYDEMETFARELLLRAYARIVQDAPLMPFGEVAPLVRRPIKVEPSKEYDELGVRSFGKGTFHKPAVSGATVVKKLYRIEAGDLVFNNVFAWEGAVAVARPEDHGRVGSHRFLTCVPKEGSAKSSFLCFHFSTERGLQQLGEASPGSAGRNRTCNIKRLEKLEVPVPTFEKQMWFDALQSRLDGIKQSRAETQKELDALVPSVLAKAFAGEL